jgi:hypothetical protein
VSCEPIGVVEVCICMNERFRKGLDNGVTMQMQAGRDEH